MSPPIKKPITAINEGNCKLLKPDMACPEVHPPAYLAPNPTSKPPTASSIKCFRSKKELFEFLVANNSVGWYALPALAKPSSFNFKIVSVYD